MNWKKVKFLDAFTDITGGNQKFKTNEYLSTGEIPVIDQGKELVAGYIDDFTAFDNVPVIVFGDHTRILKYIDFPFVLGADGVKILKPRDDINPKYAYYVLQKVYIPNTGYNRHFKWLKEAEIRLPDLTTQQHIAQVLDQADALRQQNRQLLGYYDELLQSTFIDLFGDPVKNEKGWEVRELSNVISKIESGWSPVCLDYSRNSDNEWAVLKLGAISNRVFKPNDNKKLPPHFEGRKDIEVNNGDLLFSRKNSRHLVGATVFVFETPKHLIMPDTVFRLKYNNVVNPIYLLYLFNHVDFRIRIQDLATGSSGSMPNISKEKLMNQLIPLPSLSLQQHFAKIVEEIEAQKSLVQQSLAESEALFEGLLAEYFG